MDRLLSEMPSRALTEWQAYFTLEPWGAEWENILAGLGAAATYNVNRDPQKRSEPFQPGDFVLLGREDATVVEKSPGEIYAIVRTIALMSGAKVSRGR